MEGIHEQLGRQIGKLVDDKDISYGNAIDTVPALMRVLYPNGVKPEQYRDFCLLVRDMDKSCRIALGVKKFQGENPWLDKAGYGLRGAND
jgi:hypothetical protein